MGKDRNVRERIRRCRERQELVVLNDRIEQIQDRFEPDLRMLNPRSEDAQKVNYDLAEATSGYHEHIASILERQIKHDAKKYSLSIPSRYDRPDFWQKFIDGDRYYLSDTGRSFIYKEIILRRYYQSSTYSAYIAVGISMVSLFVSIYVATQLK